MNYVKINIYVKNLKNYKKKVNGFGSIQLNYKEYKKNIKYLFC